MKKREDFEVEGLSFQFCTDSMIYYRNVRTRELDETLGDLHGLIVGRKSSFSGNPLNFVT